MGTAFIFLKGKSSLSGLYFIPPGWTYLPPEYLGGMKNMQGKTSYHQFLAYQPPALWVAAAGEKEGKS